MKPAVYLTMLVAFAASHDALALGHLADVTVIDRDTGTTLSTYFHRGEYWVAGRPGARYAIAIHNRLDTRLLAVTSIDGVNVISGATAGWDQTGYVFRPGERSEIDGWRKSDTEVAAFTFTDVADSYAARTGRRGNIGVIGIAVFRERPPPQVYAPLTPPTIASPAPSVEPDQLPRSAESASAVPAPLNSGSATRAEAPRTQPPADAAALGRSWSIMPKLGTGHGEREYSYVNHTDFERMQSQPNEVIRIRYDSLENLVAMGIVRPSRLSPSSADPFPASRDEIYVPDPPG